MIDATRTGRIELRAVSARGGAHRCEGSVRQDAFALSRSRNGRWLVAAVCDGVGSARLSDIGARVAANRAVWELTESLSKTDKDLRQQLSNAVQRTTTALRAEAMNRRNCELADLATTITVLAIDSTAEAGSHRYVVGGVGDSPVLKLGVGGALRPLAPKVAAEVHSSATAALPWQADSCSHYAGELAVGEVLLIATDGFATLATQDEPARYFGEHWRAPVAPATFAADVEFVAKSYDDDRTVVAVWATAGQS
ncbi:protein phosphatase 2C domain-containing protein [Virgisporangium aliadipatigenens]|uniref:protein phosphatase 2C domain-containing protein n=1 Tax=Virgisporangium aliadipatigenens TaxID=741659 RepID=UPI001EF36788|nr:protein phosphatase 2C domain-containing protein [Virgisporangium aliadipatigenens]